MAFGFFGKKKKEDEPSKPDSAASGVPAEAVEGAANGALQANPAKARVFFERAQAIHETTNYEYAMTLWLQGMRLDPTAVGPLESFARSASEFLNGPSRPKGPTKDQLAAFGGRTPVDKYLNSLLQWSCKPLDWSLGLRAFEQAVKLQLQEPAYWLGKRVLGLAGEDRKARKDAFLQMMSLFTQIGAFDQAVVAGEIACRLDPADGKLAAEVKNISAQATIKRSGFEEGSKVEAGAFRRNVRDISAQRAKEEEERIVKTEEVQDRAIASAKADYESRPTDVSAIQKLARLLLERGAPEDEKSAYQILTKGYSDTQNYRFRQLAGDIKLRIANRKLRELRLAHEGEPANEELRSRYVAAQRQVLEEEVKEFEDRVQNNPTDLQLRYELGQRCLRLGADEKAIEHFQMARGSPSIATHVLTGLGTAFARLGWLDEAESSFRDAVASHPVQNDDLSANLKYGLMDVLARRAEESRQLSLAEEAFKLASAIAVQRINYKDIRARRQQLQELVKSLRPGG